MAVTEQATSTRAREAARVLASATTEEKDAALAAIADAIERRASRIIEQNAVDVEAAASERPAIVDRLTLDERRTAGLADAVRAVADLPDPCGSVIREMTLENGLRLTRHRVPLGVILVVYEARPNV